MKLSLSLLVLGLALSVADDSYDAYQSQWQDYGKGSKGPHRHWLKEKTRPHGPVPTNYDYIVVGGGAAGCVIAARLSENPNITVALIEGGKPTQRSVGGRNYVAARYGYDKEGNFKIETPLTLEDVPAYSNQVRPPQHPWWPIIQNEPTRIIPGSQSSMALGGSMTHNNMVWVRGTKTHIDGWNLTGWSFNDILPYYIRSENVTGSSQVINPTYHGFSGPIHISDPVSTPAAGYAYVNACQVATGLPYNADFNGPTRAGCGPNNVNVYQGIRDSSAHVYLGPALKRPNLYVFVFSIATKILFNTTKNAKSNALPKTAGLQFSQFGTFYNFTVNKEVVVSAGIFKTPQLLMLSGIGPKAELKKNNIPVVYASEQVGKNFAYQNKVSGSYYYPNSSLPSLYGVGAASLQYATNYTGILAGTGLYGWLFYQPNTSNTASVYISISFSTTNPNVLSYGCTNANPDLPLGVVTLNSSNPFDPPVVTTNTFGNKTDLLTLAGCIQVARKIFTSPPMTSYASYEITPGAAYNTTELLEQYVNNTGSIAAHLHGTSQMTNPGDNSGVIDTHLRVFGVTGLRIADTSIIPSIDAHAQATVIAIGERAADFILTGQ